MAVIGYPIPDEAIVEYLRLVRGFETGDGEVSGVDVRAAYIASNESPSVEVTLRFDVELSQLKQLIQQQ